MTVIRKTKKDIEKELIKLHSDWNLTETLLDIMLVNIRDEHKEEIISLANSPLGKWLFEKKLDFKNLDERISHLSKFHIIQIISKYYIYDTPVSKILNDYKIELKITEPYILYEGGKELSKEKFEEITLVRLFPKEIREEICEFCNIIMVKDWNIREWADVYEETYCINCGHIPDEVDFCPCKRCEKEREKERKKQAKLEEEEEKKKLLEQKEKVIYDFYKESNWKLIPESELTLEDRLYLAVILRSSLSENTQYIEPLFEKKGTIAPTKEFELEIIRTLRGRSILIPHLISDLVAFEVKYNEEGEPQVSIYPFHVCYRINVEPNDYDYSEMINRLLYPDFIYEEDFREFCFEMWKKVALNEVLEYLLFQMEKVGYSFTPGEKTYKVFKKLLEDFSVAQINGMIYRAIANSTQRYQAKEITKIHAQNSVITSCEQYGEKAIAQGWTVTPYSRNHSLPESMISKILFTTIMKIDYLGFSEKPTYNF